MKVALVTDQHFGARNDNIAFSNYFQKFYENQFFPYLSEHGIDTIVDLGDTFDRRKYINYNSLSMCKEYWFDRLRDSGLFMHIIVGNHDTFYKSTNRINAPNLLLKEYSNLRIYKGPEEIKLDDLPVAILPWICSGNQKETNEFLTDTRAEVVMGHLEIAGFEMYRGAINEVGLDKSIFSKFDMVMSGHFHHKSSYDNIHYLGAPYEITWSDWNDPRGFHVFDTDKRELTFIQNRYNMFNKLHYSDEDKELEQILNINTDALEGHIVKVVVHSKNNPYWFDMFINKIEQVGVLDLQIVDDNLNLDLDTDEELAENIEDTLTILNKYTDQFKDRVSITRLKGFLHDLYHEALSENNV